MMRSAASMQKASRHPLGRFAIFVAMVAVVLLIGLAWQTKGFTDWPTSWERFHVWAWQATETSNKA